MAITEEEKTKAYKQFKLYVGGVLSVFHMHGMGAYVPDAIEQIAEGAVLLNKRLNGLDIPITLELAEARRRKRYMK